MHDIEFIGPSGAGKSAIQRRLLQDRGFYGGVGNGAIQRHLDYRFIKWLPARFTEWADYSIFRRSLERELFAAFISEYQKYPRVIERAINTVDEQHETTISRMSIDVAVRHQLSVTTKHPDEVLCLDEVFGIHATSIGGRTPGYQLPTSEYFDAIPLPKILIHIDAPPDVCQKRQQARGSDPHTIEMLEDARDACATIVDKMEDRGTIVIRVENTGKLSDAVNSIRSELQKSLSRPSK